MATAAAQSTTPFVKQLASSDKRIRDRALTSLRAYLQRTAAFDELELRKLWKGLYYCMWMSDKPRNQQQLARDLADLVKTVATVNFLPFVDAFWKTISGEWKNIDRLRLDKFLYLVRCYVNTGFNVVSKNDWEDKKLLKEYLAVLSDTPLEARDTKIPNGLRYHVIDVYIDELDNIDNTDTAPIEEILAPLKQLREQTLTKAVRKKIDEALKDDRLRDWPNRAIVSNDDEGEDSKDAEKASDEVAEDDFGGFGD